jgi:murein DD-endopeptidase MepM/ murein hydrolase activator NlpD
MKTKNVLAVSITMFFSMILLAQKDTLNLSCPMNDAIMRNQKGDYKFNAPDMLVVIVSKTDTAARACIDGKVTSVARNAEGNYDVVMFFKKYYMWYSGITKPLVAKGSVVKAGQPLGLVPPGNELEFLLYKEDTPINPRQFLLCKQ